METVWKSRCAGHAALTGPKWRSFDIPGISIFRGIVRRQYDAPTSARSCEVVGTGRVTSGGAFAAGWNGTSWTAQAVPGPAGAKTASLTKVSCATATACEAVGGSSAGAYTAAWNGTAWSAQSVLPVPSGSVSDTLLGVACTSATACTAVGYSQGSASASARPTLAEVWNGTSWSVQGTPNPAATSNALDGVSCVAAGSCVAVGSAPDPGGYSATLVEATG
jgi:hypothetical protein